MPAPAARLTDTISHGGNIIGGSINVLTLGLPQARLGDPVYCQEHSFEGDIQTITSGSLTVLTNALPSARIGDSIS
jgi:uncharacterized Zn-binding protein involved in type VI secretion